MTNAYERGQRDMRERAKGQMGSIEEHDAGWHLAQRIAALPILPGKTLTDERVMEIAKELARNIVTHLGLGHVCVECLQLAEDAIRAALKEADHA